MKHIRIRWFFVWAVSLMLVACKEDVPPIDIALQPNYQGILEAITQSNKTLAEKVALIEAAQRDGLADDQAAIGMIQQAVRFWRSFSALVISFFPFMLAHPPFKS